MREPGRVERLPPLSIHAWLRFDAIQRLLPASPASLLEVGMGQGSAGALLSRRFRYTGLEPDPTSFATAVARVGTRGELHCLDSDHFTPSQPFDVVCAFEVIEHLEDDTAALVSWKRFVRPGGHMVVSVPAGRGRFAATDVKAGHYRRYDRGDLIATLESAGLTDVEVVAYGFPLGYALESARNVVARHMHVHASLEDRTAASGRWLQPPPAAATVLAFVSYPFRLAQRPFSRTTLGTGLVARARRVEAR